MAKIIITKQEMWDLGFEKVVIDGVEHVDKTPLITDSHHPLTLAYYGLIRKKSEEYWEKQELIENQKKKGGEDKNEKKSKNRRR